MSIAYDRNVAASAAGGITTLYGISQSGSLVTIGGVNSTPSPNLGQVFAVGALGATPDDEHVGFDITAQNNAYVSMTVGGDTGLYTVNLATGAAALVGNIGNGDLAIRDLAVEIQVDDAASQYTSLASPARLVDTRLDTSKVGPGGTLVVGVAGNNGIPANATAAILNVTVTQPDAGGFTTVYPTGGALPTTSTVNVDGPGQTRAAFATVPLGSNGSVSVFSERGSQIIVDVVGYYGPAVTAAGRLVPLVPSRILDTRSGTGVPAGGTAKLAANQTIELQVTGRGGVPAIDPANPTNVSAAIVNVTATQTTAPGFFTAFPGGTSQPMASTLNASETDETIANLAVVRVGPTGTIQLFSETGGHLIVDVGGLRDRQRQRPRHPPWPVRAGHAEPPRRHPPRCGQRRRRQCLDRRSGDWRRRRAGRWRARPRRHGHRHPERRQRLRHGASRRVDTTRGIVRQHDPRQPDDRQRARPRYGHRRTDHAVHLVGLAPHRRRRRLLPELSRCPVRSR